MRLLPTPISCLRTQGYDVTVCLLRRYRTGKQSITLVSHIDDIESIGP